MPGDACSAGAGGIKADDGPAAVGLLGTGFEVLGPSVRSFSSTAAETGALPVADCLSTFARASAMRDSISGGGAMPE